LREKLRGHRLAAAFLDQVCAQIRDKRRRLEVRDELLSHLEAELGPAAELSEQVLAEAIEKFGDPKILGQNLRRAQRTWPQKFAAWTAGAAAFALVILYLSSSYFLRHYERTLAHFSTKLASRMERFTADQRALSQFEVLKETSGLSRDAGEFLNSRIEWWPEQEVKIEITVPDTPGGGGWNSASWITHPLTKEQREADLSWTTLLLEYDHWDLFQHGPLQKYLGRDAPLVNPFSTPMPSVNLLSKAAKLRLRRGLDQREILPALKEARHLGRLAYTTETLVGSMNAVAIWKTERAAFEEAVKRGLIKATDYSPVDPENLKRMKTTLWVTTGFAEFTQPEQSAKAFLQNPWPVGSCAALAEAAQTFIFTAVFLEKKYPFEVDMADRMTIVHRLYEASKPHCRLTFFRQLLERPREYANVMMIPGSFAVFPDWQGFINNYKYLWGQHLPYLRQGLGMEFVAIARPSFTDLYDRE